MGIECSKPREETGARSEYRGNLPVDCAMEEVGPGADNSGKNNAREAGAVSLMLRQLAEPRHKRYHDGTSTEAEEPPKATAKQTYDKADNLFQMLPFILFFVRRYDALFHKEAHLVPGAFYLGFSDGEKFLFAQLQPGHALLHSLLCHGDRL